MSEPALPTSFDELIDRALRGEAVDADAYLAANPQLSEHEKKQVRQLCGGPDPAAVEGRSAPEQPPPVERVGTYRLRERIGVGSTGAVFLAEDETLGRRVAVKILGPDIHGTGERADRFLREIRAAARLRHPNIVTVHAAGEQNGIRYMAMELVPGTSLDEVIARAAARGSRPPLSDVLRWGAGIARALQAAHDAGITHRDVKPSNIRIAEDGRAVLLDFGLARDATDSTLTEPGSFRGSPQYASPEQVESGRLPIDARTDVYSLAATLYEVLTGVAPCRGETREQLFHAILARDPVPVRRLDPDVPRDLETVILASLRKDPALRHPTARALADDLDAVRDGRPVSVRPPSPAGRAVRWARRNPAKAGLALALAALVVAVPVIVTMGGFIRTNLPKIEKAEAHEKALRLDALLAEGFLEYGEGEPLIAETHFAEAMRLDPDSVEAKAGYVLARVLQQDAASGLAFLDGLPPPMNTAGWVEQIRSMSARHAGAASRSDSRETAPPPQGSAIEYFVAGVVHLDEAHRNVGNAPEAAASATKAFESLRQAVLLSRDAKAAYYYELGHAAWHAQEHAEARKIAAAIGRLWPESPVQWFAIGRTLIDADRKAALDAFERAARKPPRALEARSLIATRLCEFPRGPADLAQATELARGLVAEFPTVPRAHRTLGIVLINDGKIEAAIQALTEAVRLDPNDGHGHRVLAQAYLRSRQTDRALASGREAARLTPRMYQSWLGLGVVLIKVGKLDEGIESLERAIELNPRSADALGHLGAGLLTRGEFGRGLARLKEGYAIGSRDPRWKTATTRVIAQAEQLVRMEKSIVAGFGDGPDSPADPAGRLRLREQARIWFEEDLARAEREVAREPSRWVFATATIRSWAASQAGARTQSWDAEDLMTSEEVLRWRELWARYARLMGEPAETRPVTR